MNAEADSLSPRALANVRVAVVVATKDRSSELANRCLRSIADQTRSPDYLVVVDDSTRRFRADNRRIVSSLALPKARVIYLPNDRTDGASGAWNVALDTLHREVEDPQDIFVAVLDDDDEWDRDYLRQCIDFAQHGDYDMVGADIRRIEGADMPPVLSMAPDVLRAEDFLVGNPGIQGSNLFVRFSVLLEAGLFDERLRTNTDRDLCIRISDLGSVRYGRLPKPLVRHYAEPTRERLSKHGSPLKMQGLTAFWNKYRFRMTEDQQDAFTKRARDLFGWEKDSRTATAPNTTTVTPVAAATVQQVALIVGIIVDATRPEHYDGLIADLIRLSRISALAGFEVMILDNGPRAGEPATLSKTAALLRDEGIGCYMVTQERQREDAAAGLFGTRFDRPFGRQSIAAARTMLQGYLHIVARTRAGAVVWVLDGDCRLSNLVWSGDGKLDRRTSNIVSVLARLREMGIDIAIGTFTGDPPVPAASCARTQLVDAYHNLEWFAALNPDMPLPLHLSFNMSIRCECADYYYDLSRRDTDHLETPFWYMPTQADCTVGVALREMITRLPRIFAGEQVFRPLILDGRSDPIILMKPSVHRGGNTFVFDPGALQDYPNASPHIGGTQARRSDMVWSLLNSYVARRRVVQLPIAVRHDRSNEEHYRLDLEKLARDIQGYAMYSAIEDVLLDEREERRRNGDAPSGLDRIDASALHVRVRKYLAERFAAFSLSFHRISGLSRLFGRYIGESREYQPWWLTRSGFSEELSRLSAFVEHLRQEYDVARLPQFKSDVFKVTDEEVAVFLEDLRSDVKAREKPTATDKCAQSSAQEWARKERVRNAQNVVSRHFKSKQLRFLGIGSEAVVLTDDHTVFKCLDYWKSRFPEDRLNFLHSQVGRWSELPGLYPLREIRKCGHWVVITYDFEPSIPYKGGHGEGLVRLVQSCRKAGIVCDNIHPQNLIVTRVGEVKLIDYGSDILPYDEDRFIHMARRAYLSFRFSDRADLKDLMRKAITDFNLPECEGFDLFLKAIEPTSKEQILDEYIADALGDGRGRSCLDYGCGKGKLAYRLAERGWEVTGYDPDKDLASRWRTLSGRVKFGNDDLRCALRQQRARFDVAVCILVLCVLEDVALREALSDLRELTAIGGKLIVAVCNPREINGTTQLQRRIAPEGATAQDRFHLKKHMFATGAQRVDVHRPEEDYRRLFQEFGFAIDCVEQTPAVNLDTFVEASDFMIFRLTRSLGEGG